MSINFTDKPNETLYIYCRVSTRGQDKDGVSLEVQEERGLEFSKKLNLTPIVIKEQGSGLKLYEEERPLFTELIDGVTDGLVKHIWVDELTRLTRNTLDQTTIYLEFVQNQINYYRGNDTKSVDTDSFEVDLMDTIIT